MKKYMKGKEMKKITYFLFSLLLGVALESQSAATEDRVLLSTINWPSSFLQPGYQMAIAQSGFQPTNRSISVSWNSTAQVVFGLNNVQSQGYMSCAIVNTNSFFLARSVLTNTTSNFLYGWSDVLFTARSFERQFVGMNGLLSFTWLQNIGFDGSGGVTATASSPFSPSDIYYVTVPQQQQSAVQQILEGGYLYADSWSFDTSSLWPWQTSCYTTLTQNQLSATYPGSNTWGATLNVVNYSPVSPMLINHLGGLTFSGNSIPRNAGGAVYSYPFYEDYYSNLGGSTTPTFVTSDTELLSNYLEPMQNLFANTGALAAVQSLQSSLQANLSAQAFSLLSLPGSNNTYAGDYFLDVYIPLTSTVKSLVSQSFLASLTSYSTVFNTSLALGSGVTFYVPIFMTDPGNPYYPTGWNYANTQSNFDPNKATLMTNFYEQLITTSSVCTPGV